MAEITHLLVRDESDYMPSIFFESSLIFVVVCPAAHPLTGRTHQIRVHLASLSHPLVGDTKYNNPTFIRRHAVWCSRLFLHAQETAFLDVGGERVHLKAGIPEELQNVLAGMTEVEDEANEDETVVAADTTDTTAASVNGESVVGSAVESDEEYMSDEDGGDECSSPPHKKEKMGE